MTLVVSPRLVFVLALATEVCCGLGPFHGSAPFSRAQQLTAITSAAQLRSLITWKTEHALPVRLEAVVTYADPRWTMLFVQDATGAAFVNVPKVDPAVQTGHRVAIEGTSSAGKYSPIVNQPTIQVMGKAPLPAAQPVTLLQLQTGQFDCHWVEVRATVQAVTDVDNRLTLDLVGDGPLLRTFVLGVGSRDLGTLVGAQVRLRGVCGVGATEARELRNIQFYVPSRDHLVIERAAPADPFARPLESMAGAQKLVPAPGSGRDVHLQGRIERLEADGTMLVADATGSLRVASPPPFHAQPGMMVEIVGRLARNQDQGEVLAAAVRRLGVTGGKPLPGDPAFTTVKEVRGMTLEQLQERRPVRLRGTVTFVDPQTHAIHFQDGTGGMSAQTDGQPLDVQPGHSVTVEGRAAPGDFSPVLEHPRFQILGTVALPHADEISATALHSGANEGLWKEVTGIVRAAHVGDGFCSLEMAAGGNRFRALVAAPTPSLVPPELVDAKLNLRGVCSMILNPKKQPVGAQVNVPSAAHLFVVRPAAAPFTLPVEPIQRLLRHRPKDSPVHRVRVQGVVTLQRSNGSFVQDATGAVFVSAAEPPLAVGTHVDVVGFPEAHDHTPMLVQPLSRSQGKQPLPEPLPLVLDQIFEASPEQEPFDGLRVRIQAQLLDQLILPQDKSLILGHDHHLFHAILANSVDGAQLAALPRGSLLELTGVCKVRFDETRLPRSVDLHVQGLEDIQVLASPPWWTLMHALQAGGGAAAIFVVIVCWVVVLRQRVRQQTAVIRERLEREAALEERYRELFENANDAIYTHDFQGRFTSFNKAAEQISGYSRAEALQHQLADFLPPDQLAFAREMTQRKLQGEEVTTYELVVLTKHQERRTIEISSRLVREGGKPVAVHGIARDITDRKEAEAEVAALHQRLLEVSHRAGMAEVATNILHNVGNVLNSVNVATALMGESLRQSKVDYLRKAAELLQAHAGDLPDFLTHDPRGSLLPSYLSDLARHLGDEQNALRKELGALTRNLDHLKNIIAQQQRYARTHGATEALRIADLVDEALRINEELLSQHHVEVVREYTQVPSVAVEKHKLLQILVNLIRNAAQALAANGQADPRLVVRVAHAAEQLRIVVSDNGIGIAPEHLPRIFAHGFSTRPDGHGFGLHSGFLTAREMGGSLRAASNGPGQGAEFILELPCLATKAVKEPNA